MNREKVIFKSLGYNLVGIIEYPKIMPAPGMILCHGFSNTKEDCPLLKETTKMLIDNGFITFRFDYFGSGESPGTMKEKTISILEQNTKDAIDFFLPNEKVTKVGMWGRSLGGTLVALCGSDPRIPVTIIASVVFFMKKVFNKRTINELVKKEEEMEQRGGRLAGTGHYKGEYGLNDLWYSECEEYEDKLTKSLEQMSRVLILGTSPDEKVPSENSIAIYNIVKNSKEIHIFGNTNHAYEGAENEALSLIRRWVKIHLRR